ncbi:MAG: PDZ domain-containing protein [Gemmatimonadetes bacterium]|nr:PDZ domain-containing protein [Gemmatimonadota bacterium]
MKRTVVLSGLMLVTVHGSGQGQVLYDVRFPNAVHHEAEISVTFADLPARPLELRMSRSSPGRYALHEFAKNVYAVRAVGAGGEALRVTRPNPYQWDVPEHGDTVRVSYTLFADRAGGTYSQVDETHAHFNIPATFMWARGLGDREIRVAFHPPEGSGWQVATQLMPTDDPMTYTAPNLYYFLDSPTELSAFSMRQWTIASGDTVRMAVHHAGTEEEVDRFVEWTKRVVQQEIAVFGEPPDFDGGTYTFIADYLPYVSGDGMEHRNSTILSSTQSLGGAGRGLLGTVSHEFFHAWNVERIRPRSLEPFDFERANMSGELWFAEGFTSYYTQLLIRRAGLTTDADYARTLGGGLSFVTNAAGRRYFSPVEMSMQAPFVDAATAVDPNNRGNTFISYYTWGSVIGLNLDLTLRSRFEKSLDGFMRSVWVRFGKTEIPYTIDDLQQTLARFTGDDDFAEDFFARFIRGREVPDYAALLANAGFLLRPAQPDAAWMGTMNLQYRDGSARLAGMPPEGSPLYEAGVSRGDRILSMDGQVLENASTLRQILGAHRPGDRVEVMFEQRGRNKTVMMLLAPHPQLEVVLYEDAGMTVTPEMTAFRAAWTEAATNGV